MADLIGFLTDRLDEDERRAELAAAIMSQRPTTAPFGQRLLAEVQAKRHIIDEHPAVTERTSWDEERTICDRCRYDDGLDTYTFPCPTLCLLALPYDTHEDYDEAWRP